jgi:hypothetical protein
MMPTAQAAAQFPANSATVVAKTSVPLQLVTGAGIMGVEGNGDEPLPLVAGAGLSRTVASDTNSVDVVLLEREGASVGTAISSFTPTLNPKNTVTIEIGKEALNTPIVYRSNSNKDQILLRVPMCTTEQSFERSMQRTKFLKNLLENLGPDVEVSTKWLLTALAKKSGKIYEEVARERGFITTQSKKMDAHSAAAMWRDANVNLRQQRAIKRHLGAYFGAQLMVPESEVKEQIDKVHNPEVLAAHKKAMEKTSRKRKSTGDTKRSGNLTAEQMRLPSGNMQPHETSKLEYKDNNI